MFLHTTTTCYSQSYKTVALYRNYSVDLLWILFFQDYIIKFSSSQLWTNISITLKSQKTQWGFKSLFHGGKIMKWKYSPSGLKNCWIFLIGSKNPVLWLAHVIACSIFVKHTSFSLFWIEYTAKSRLKFVLFCLTSAFFFSTYLSLSVFYQKSVHNCELIFVVLTHNNFFCLLLNMSSKMWTALVCCFCTPQQLVIHNHTKLLLLRETIQSISCDFYFFQTTL